MNDKGRRGRERRPARDGIGEGVYSIGDMYSISCMAVAVVV